MVLADCNGGGQTLRVFNGFKCISNILRSGAAGRFYSLLNHNKCIISKIGVLSSAVTRLMICFFIHCFKAIQLAIVSVNGTNKVRTRNCATRKVEDILCHPAVRPKEQLVHPKVACLNSGERKLFIRHGQEQRIRCLLMQRRHLSSEVNIASRV